MSSWVGTEGRGVRREWGGQRKGRRERGRFDGSQPETLRRAQEREGGTPREGRRGRRKGGRRGREERERGGERREGGRGGGGGGRGEGEGGEGGRKSLK